MDDGGKGLTGEVWRLVEPVALQAGLEVVDVEYLKGGPGMVLRITIDKDGGVTIDDCAAFSQLVGDILDVVDPIPGPYHLEVSSPGINRPLKRPQDFRRFAGERVVVETAPPLQGRRRFKGRLLGLTQETVSVECYDGVHEIPLSSIKKARLDIL